MVCGKCGSANGKVVNGVSRGTGKPYTMWECGDCQSPFNGKMYPTRTPMKAEISAQFQQPAQPVQKQPEKKDGMTSEEWYEKEKRDHRRRIMLGLMMNSPETDINELYGKAEDVLKYTLHGYRSPQERAEDTSTEAPF